MQKWIKVCACLWWTKGWEALPNGKVDKWQDVCMYVCAMQTYWAKHNTSLVLSSLVLFCLVSSFCMYFVHVWIRMWAYVFVYMSQLIVLITLTKLNHNYYEFFWWIVVKSIQVRLHRFNDHIEQRILMIKYYFSDKS